MAKAGASGAGTPLTHIIGGAVAVLVLLTLSVTAARAVPDVAAIMTGMKAALEPARSSVRLLTLEIGTPGGRVMVGTAAQARKIIDGHPQMLMVLLEPDALRGTAWLLQEGAKDRPDEQWVYLPSLRRVRRVAPLTTYSAVLGSDFSFTDLAFEKLHSNYRLLGILDQRGARTYQVEARFPKSEENRQYSRILTWVDAKTFLPVKRDFYDLTGNRYRAETFERSDTIDGVPTITRIRMENVLTGDRSDINIRSVRYGVDIPDTLFDPKKLHEASTAPLFQVGDAQ